jgi:hypothetical protein
MPMGDGSGSTGNLRFNPRQSAEEIEEDSSVGREDSEERAKHDAKKREEQEKRARLMQGIQHLKIKIPQQNTDDEERPTEEAGELAGQVGQADAIDGANPRGNGLGMGIMTGEPIDLAFDMIRKKKDEPKFDTGKTSATETLERVKARKRGEKGSKRKTKKTKTLERMKQKREAKGKGKPLKTDTGRNPAAYTGFMAGQRATQPSMQYSRQTRTIPRYLTLASMRSGPAKVAYEDPREREQEAQIAQRETMMPTQPVTPSTPTVTADSRIAHAPRGTAKHRKAIQGVKRITGPKEPDTPLGKVSSKASDLATGGSSLFAPLLAKGMTIRDKQEYRRLIQKLEKLLRNLTKKGDASADGVDDGPTPNAHPRMTSAPTGATETDPDDDPTMWGTHAYGLYAGRGGIA